MASPSPKKLSKLSPNVLKYGIPRQLVRDYGGKKFEGYRDRCERCGSKHISKFGFKERTYATVIQPCGFYDVNVHLRRYRCMECHHIMVCDEELFYPGTRYGRGIVDACLFLTSSNPYNRVENLMLDYGIQIDIQSIRRYAIHFGREAGKKAPLRAMGQKVELGANLVRIIFDRNDAKELREEHPDGKYDGVADETYPSQKGSKKEHREENRTKKALGERQERFGSSFTLATSYLHNLRCYASLIISLMPFNQIFAEALLRCLKGCDYILSDGSHNYNGFVDERCLWHFMKNFFNKFDNGLMRMKRHEMLPWMISQHMHEIYSIAREEYIKHLAEKYPKLVEVMDDGSRFLGATTTNSIEGGNWRVKYELRVPYQLAESIFARALLIELRDSLYTFRNGHAEESFAHRNGVFSYSRIMRGDEEDEILGEPHLPPIRSIEVSAL
jgi:hypothetical protein